MKKKRLKFTVFPRHIIEQPLMALDREGKEIPLPPHLIFSITDPNSNEAKIPVSPTNKGILRQQFWDIVNHDRFQSEEDKKRYERIFTEDDALQIIHFFQQHVDEVDMIFCHCEAGISRSSAVAAALALLCNGDDQHFFAVYHPNRLVHKTILEVWKKLEDAEQIIDSCPRCAQPNCGQIPWHPDENSDSSLYSCHKCMDIFDAMDKPCWPKPPAEEKKDEEGSSPEDPHPQA